MNIHIKHTEPSRQIISRNIQALAVFAEEKSAAGSEAALLTFMFNNLSGSPAGLMAEMHDAVEQFYGSFLTRVVRYPRSPHSRDRLPVLLGAIDAPVASRRRSSPYEVRVNQGLHVHAVLIIRPGSRLRTSADEYVRASVPLYLRDPRLARVDARAVRHSPARAVSYAFKSVLRGRVPYDQSVIILPRAVSELASARKKSSRAGYDRGATASSAIVR